MAKERRAYSFVELIVIVLIIGALAYVAVPKLQFATLNRQRADTVARRMVMDLMLTRRLAISDAANNTDGYALNMTGSEPYSGYEIKNSDTEEVVDTCSFDSQVSVSGGDEFRFGRLGGLVSGSDTQLTVSSSGKTYTVTIVSATGAVKCTEN